MEPFQIISPMRCSTICGHGYIGTGLLPAQQLCKGAPWIIREEALHTESVQREANCRRARIPSSHDSRQSGLDL